jgi:acyl phosphate:glycerol-3-phosphate acyltransferase
MFSFCYIVIALLGYLLGSIPAGYLAGRIAGIDIRNSGSGNIGATNVVRVLGKRYGYPVFAIDFLKGLIAVLAAITIARNADLTQGWVQGFGVTGGVCCVMGHTFPIWLKFKGGKGVATSVGVIFGLMPVAALIVLGVWILTFELSRYVSVASIIAALALPITVLLVSQRQHSDAAVVFYFSLCLTAVIILRHRSNLGRLMRGTEPRFRRR